MKKSSRLFLVATSLVVSGAAMAYGSFIVGGSGHSRAAAYQNMYQSAEAQCGYGQTAIITSYQFQLELNSSIVHASGMAYCTSDAGDPGVPTKPGIRPF